MCVCVCVCVCVCSYVCIDWAGSALQGSIFLLVWLFVQTAEPSVLLKGDVIIYWNSQNATSSHTRTPGLAGKHIY